MDKSRFNNFNLASSNQPQGSKQIHRTGRLRNLSPDSGSNGDDKDSFLFKFGWKSSKQRSGTPIKKLIAEEMTGETESKRRSPGVVARLMGLDGLPFQQSANKQHKSSPGNHLQRATLLEKNRCRGTSYDGGRSSRRSSKDQQEFKDVFEVSDIAKVESNRYSMQGSSDLKITDAEMSFIEQKFMDAKRLATFQDLQSSKDFLDTLEVLDSNKDLLLKYFKQPDSLFKKHLNDLQAAPSESNLGHVEAIKLSDIEKYEHEFNWKSYRETTRFSYSRSHYKHGDGYPSHIDRRHAMHSSPKSSKLQFKERDIKDSVPTKIVVLKPNLGKVQNGTRIVSSPFSSHTFPVQHGNDTEFPDVRFRDTEQYQMKVLPDTARHSRQNSLESREIAKEITRQMKSSLNNGCMISSSKFRGYVGDDSSCSASGNESPGESVETPATWGTPIDLNSRSRQSSHSSESSVSREAKERLSERWKVAHKSQEVQAINRSTLAEMLANPDKEMKVASSDSVSIGESSRNRLSCNGEPARRVEPLGISSRDGWKDGYIGILPRSKSLPASSTAFGSPRTILPNEVFRDERLMMPMEAFKWERKRAAKSRDQRHGANTRSTKYGHKKPCSLHSSNVDGNEFSLDLDTIKNKMKINLEEDSPKVEVLVTGSFASIPRDTIEVIDDVVDVATEIAVGSSESEPSEKVVLELSSCEIIKANTDDADKDNSMQQELSAESSCCKDADQPSPVSVLEPSFTDDLSSCSDCFGSLSADLQGLRMQLRLLKSESEENVDGPSDEDGGEASTGISEDNGLWRTEDSWESSYIFDVLSESGIDGAQPISNSFDSPVNLSVFDELEKRYSDQTTCSRSERRLFFDSINSGIIDIHEQSVNALPWVSFKTKTISSKLAETGLQDSLYRLLGSQAKVKDDDAMGKVLVMESQWLDLKNDIDVIGNEVEIMLLDDLVAEISSM
ncbi:hypothetical protein Lal_00047519 [Lupinus albus]|uniref:Uncharacterized protein n=1 Tax=Lupinus albus TaxID=3870 RepID=A0A6A5MZ00_LUPAL|nr:hypothetical protein Lalb_Chr02g0153251 [Lupinus albus]KAF1878847.1 hypothetical protein Lal_00047519 [Lupinus albus]